MVGFSRFEQARQRHQSVADTLMGLRNVVGVGVGYKVRADVQTDEPCLAVSVTEKVPASQLPPGDLVPPAVEGVSTDVVRTGRIYALDSADWRSVMRPARPGVSIGHYQSTAGTFGCVVRRDDHSYILSNNHVLALVNRGQPGDPIYQPGPADGGAPGHTLAELADFVRLRLPGDSSDPAPSEPRGCAALIAQLLGGGSATPAAAEAPPNQVDVALARPVDPALINPSILGIGVPTGVAEAALGARVRKSGRTTGLTEANVTQVDVTADVIYGEHTVRFINQMMTEPMSRPGDSGSAIVDDSNRVVGLLFSGSDYVTLFNPISLVMAALNVEVVTA